MKISRQKLVLIATVIFLTAGLAWRLSSDDEQLRSTVHQAGLKEQRVLDSKSGKIKFNRPPAFYVFRTTQRNYQRVQFGEIRKEFDKPYNRLADELSDIYYNYWKKGKSKPWQGYDVQPTLEQSKELFDKLHGLIWHWYNVNFHKLNMSRPLEERIPEEEYNYVYGPDGKVFYKKSEHSREIIEELKKQGIEIKIK